LLSGPPFARLPEPARKARAARVSDRGTGEGFFDQSQAWRGISTTSRILIVDDDESVRRLLQATLPRDSYAVLEASDGDQALELIEQERPDLVLLDWKMPGRTGSQVLDELKQRHPALPVVVLTAEHQPPQRALAEALGVDVFLTKPFSPMELLDTVERLLAEDAPNQTA
jgi:CheY-like chemotaxis protein